MIHMTDRELEQIEREIADLHLEEYAITGIQLKAIIDRLRRAETAADRMVPFMRYYTDKDRLKRANEAWILPRLGAILLAMVSGVAATGITGLAERLMLEPSWPMAGFVILTFLIPFLLVFFGLFTLMDRTQNRRLIEGRYDELDTKPLRHEMQIAAYAAYYGRNSGAEN